MRIRKLTHKRLLSVIRYDPATGDFIRLVTLGSTAQAGDVAGNVSPRGYVRITIDYESYQANVLAWFYVTGEWPTAVVDHWDMDKGNNRWANLRHATKAQNNANSTKPRNNTSGAKGVYWHAAASKWVSQISVDNQTVYLGIYNCKAAAQFAYIVAANKHFGEFARA